MSIKVYKNNLPNKEKNVSIGNIKIVKSIKLN